MGKHSLILLASNLSRAAKHLEVPATKSQLPPGALLPPPNLHIRTQFSLAVVLHDKISALRR